MSNIVIFCGPGLLSRYGDSLVLDGTVIECRWEWDFPQPSILVYTMRPGYFTGVKRLGRGVGHTPL
jgi:hypothetical protein